MSLLMGFPYGSAGKEFACNVGDLGSIPGLGRSLGEGKGYPLQYSGLENFMDCVVLGVAKSQTWLSNFHSIMWMPRQKLLSMPHRFKTNKGYLHSLWTASTAAIFYKYYSTGLYSCICNIFLQENVIKQGSR